MGIGPQQLSEATNMASRPKSSSASKPLVSRASSAPKAPGPNKEATADLKKSLELKTNRAPVEVKGTDAETKTKLEINSPRTTAAKPRKSVIREPSDKAPSKFGKVDSESKKSNRLDPSSLKSPSKARSVVVASAPTDEVHEHGPLIGEAERLANSASILGDDGENASASALDKVVQWFEQENSNHPGMRKPNKPENMSSTMNGVQLARAFAAEPEVPLWPEQHAGLWKKEEKHRSEAGWRGMVKEARVNLSNWDAAHGIEYQSTFAPLKEVHLRDMIPGQMKLDQDFSTPTPLPSTRLPSSRSMQQQSTYRFDQQQSARSGLPGGAGQGSCMATDILDSPRLSPEHESNHVRMDSQMIYRREASSFERHVPTGSQGAGRLPQNQKAGRPEQSPDQQERIQAIQEDRRAQLIQEQRDQEFRAQQILQQQIKAQMQKQKEEQQMQAQQQKGGNNQCPSLMKQMQQRQTQCMQQMAQDAAEEQKKKIEEQRQQQQLEHMQKMHEMQLKHSQDMLEKQAKEIQTMKAKLNQEQMKDREKTAVLEEKHKEDLEKTKKEMLAQQQALQQQIDTHKKQQEFDIIKERERLKAQFDEQAQVALLEQQKKLQAMIDEQREQSQQQVQQREQQMRLREEQYQQQMAQQQQVMEQQMQQQQDIQQQLQFQVQQLSQEAQEQKLLTQEREHQLHVSEQKQHQLQDERERQLKMREQQLSAEIMQREQQLLFNEQLTEQQLVLEQQRRDQLHNQKVQEQQEQLRQLQMQHQAQQRMLEEQAAQLHDQKLKHEEEARLHEENRKRQLAQQEEYIRQERDRREREHREQMQRETEQQERDWHERQAQMRGEFMRMHEERNRQHIEMERQAQVAREQAIREQHLNARDEKEMLEAQRLEHEAREKEWAQLQNQLENQWKEEQAEVERQYRAEEEAKMTKRETVWNEKHEETMELLRQQAEKELQIMEDEQHEDEREHDADEQAEERLKREEELENELTKDIAALLKKQEEQAIKEAQFAQQKSKDEKMMRKARQDRQRMTTLEMNTSNAKQIQNWVAEQEAKEKECLVRLAQQEAHLEAERDEIARMTNMLKVEEDKRLAAVREEAERLHRLHEEERRLKDELNDKRKKLDQEKLAREEKTRGRKEQEWTKKKAKEDERRDELRRDLERKAKQAQQQAQQDHDMRQKKEAEVQRLRVKQEEKEKAEEEAREQERKNRMQAEMEWQADYARREKEMLENHQHELQLLEQDARTHQHMENEFKERMKREHEERLKEWENLLPEQRSIEEAVQAQIEKEQESKHRKTEEAWWRQHRQLEKDWKKRTRDEVAKMKNERQEHMEQEKRWWQDFNGRVEKGRRTSVLEARAEMEQLETFYEELRNKWEIGSDKGLRESSSDSSISSEDMGLGSSMALSSVATGFLGIKRQHEKGDPRKSMYQDIKAPVPSSKRWWEEWTEHTSEAPHDADAENTDGPITGHRLSVSDLLAQYNDPDWQERLRKGASDIATAGQKYKTMLASLEEQVNAVKGVLYQAQNMPENGLGRDSNEVLDYVLGALQKMQGNLEDSVALKQTIQNGARFQKKLMGALEQNQESVGMILNQQVASAQENLDVHKQTCRNLLVQISRTENELQRLHGIKDGMPFGDEPAVEPIGVPDDGLEHSNVRIEASIEGTQQILHAFANVLKPHFGSLLPKNQNDQTPAERVTFEFLRAFASAPTQAKLRFGGNLQDHNQDSRAPAFQEEVSLQSPQFPSGRSPGKSATRQGWSPSASLLMQRTPPPNSNRISTMSSGRKQQRPASAHNPMRKGKSPRR